MKKFIAEDARQLVKNCGEKFKLYMAHFIRVQNQYDRIKAICDYLCGDECSILIDSKMKFDPVYFCKKTVEYFR